MANKTGKKWKQWETLFWGAPTVDDDCNLKVKRCTLLGRKTTTNWQHVKSRDITLPKKVHIVKAMFFLLVMYGCKNWTKKKAECWRIDAFELWCLRSVLRVPRRARKSNQSTLKEIKPEYSLERLMLKLILQWCSYLIWWAEHWKRPWWWER